MGSIFVVCTREAQKSSNSGKGVLGVVTAVRTIAYVDLMGKCSVMG